ncbi:thiosulfate sulfurtransferase/rhodanese domain-containing protein 1-like, partial [Tropilaelaps mercedesae]
MSLKAIIRVAVGAVNKSAMKIRPNSPSTAALMNSKYGGPEMLQTAKLHRSSVMMMELSYEDLVALQRGGDLHLIDVREPSEIQETGKIPGAINI